MCPKMYKCIVGALNICYLIFNYFSLFIYFSFIYLLFLNFDFGARLFLYNINNIRNKQ